jgi:hypothetical protein
MYWYKNILLKYSDKHLTEGTYRYRDIASSNAIDFLETFILSDYIRFKLKGQIDYHRLFRGILSYNIQVVNNDSATEAKISSSKIYLYVDLEAYNLNYKYREYVQAALLHEVMHIFQRYSGINVGPEYWEKIKKEIFQHSLFPEHEKEDIRILEIPQGYKGDNAINVNKYFSSPSEFQATVFEVDYLMNYNGWSEEEIIDFFVTPQYQDLSEAMIRRVIEVVKSPTPREYTEDMGQKQLFRMNSRFNWYKISQKEEAYHGTSYDNAEKILTHGFDTYVSWDQFENYFNVFYNDLSFENQEKIEVPKSKIGSKWENAVDQLMELWYKENPNMQIIWVTHSPEIAEDFGHVVLEVDISDMEHFFDDMGYGWCEKYQGSVIPPEKFKLSQ